MKKRLIFTLIYDNGNFMLSRNFRLQKVGDFKWLKKHYNFEKIAFSIDELVILDVTRKNREVKKFSKVIKEVISNVFVPVSVGGGIRTVSDADLLLKSGADKILLNTILTKDKSVVKELVKRYGSQFIIASIDYLVQSNEYKVYIENGSFEIDYNLSEYLDYIKKLNIGEIYLNSISKDGTGQGFDILNQRHLLKKIVSPLIIAGGAGNENHLIEALKNKYIDAVATANLFNFLGDSLPKSRQKILDENIKVAIWK